MPQVAQQVDAGIPFIPRELLATEPSKDKLDSWGAKIRDAIRTGTVATTDNYMDVRASIKYSLMILKDV